MKTVFPTSSTRSAVCVLLAGAFAAGAICCISAPVFAAPKPTPTIELAPLSEEQRALHVLNRLAFGPRTGDVKNVRKIGVSQWIESQLSPQNLNDSAVELQLRRFQTLEYSNQKLWLAYTASETMRRIKANERKKTQAEAEGKIYNPKFIGDERQRVLDDARRAGFDEQTDLQIVGEMQAAKLLRATASKRQLQEVLVDFWSNHFNLDISKKQVQTLRLADERDAIRPHVLGKFREMLGASAHSPAMMFYLDNARSTVERAPLNEAQKQRRGRNQLNNAKRQAKLARKQPQATAPTEIMGEEMKVEAAPTPVVIQPRRRGGINENYARELMELHTLGVNGGYTQKDVTEVARCFTGWSVGKDGAFEFFPARHDNGEKTVLGQKIPAGGGQKDGLRVLDLLAKNPATARHISRKLAMRLVNDNPPPALVERAAQTFLKTDGDLRAVTKTIVSSPEFFAPQNYRAKIKSPFEYAVSGVRALDGQLLIAGIKTPDERAMLIGDAVAITKPNRGNRLQNKTLGRQIAQMGQPLYAFQAPTGYSENSSTWVSSGALIARLNFALDLTNGRLLDVDIKRDAVFKGVSFDDHNAMLSRLIDTTLHGEISASTRKVVDAQIKPDAPFDAAKAGALLLGSPEFQRR